MISFLSLCGKGTGIQPVWNVVNYLVNIIMIGVPIILILWGMVDLGKAVIASKEDEVKKATKLLGRRFLYAVAVFLVVWAVTFLFNTLSSTMDEADGFEKSDPDSWKQCWKCNIRKSISMDDPFCASSEE